MSGNKSFARSMNGINNIEINEVQFPDGSTITSASNLVQLDTTNDFTSNNSFNSNLPTSTKEHAVGELTDNMILNKKSADLLYVGNDEISECFDGASITGRDITLTRVDNANPKVIAIPETSLSTCVLKTTDQEIDGIKTFVDFPKIKLTEADLGRHPGNPALVSAGEFHYMPHLLMEVATKQRSGPQNPSAVEFRLRP